MPLAAMVAVGVRRRRPAAAGPRTDLPGARLALLCAAATVLAVAHRRRSPNSVTTGTASPPSLTGVGVSSPVAPVALVSALAFIARELTVAAAVRPRARHCADSAAA